jgi:hypothetical protein
VFYRPAAATMAWRVLREPLGYSRKLGERLLGSKLGDLLGTLANCPEARSASVMIVLRAAASVSATLRAKA